MHAILSDMKDIEFAEPMVTIRSALKEVNMESLCMLAEAMV